MSAQWLWEREERGEGKRSRREVNGHGRVLIGSRAEQSRIQDVPGLGRLSFRWRGACVTALTTTGEQWTRSYNYRAVGIAVLPS